MNIYVNSEKHLVNVGEITYQDIIKMSGYPLDRQYKIIDEVSNNCYYDGDTICIHNNISLMVYSI